MSLVIHMNNNFSEIYIMASNSCYIPVSSNIQKHVFLYIHDIYICYFLQKYDLCRYFDMCRCFVSFQLIYKYWKLYDCETDQALNTKVNGLLYMKIYLVV